MQKPAFSISNAFPHLIEQDKITIPRSLFYLSTSSILVSFFLLIVSLLDLGYCSLWLTPPACIFTLIYFVGVLYVSQMERTSEDPTYFPTVVFVGYLMTLIWLIAFILTIVVFAAYPHMVEALEQRGLHTVAVGLQRFQCILCITNLSLVGGFTARSHVIAMEEGDPENWRLLVEKAVNPTVNRQIRLQRSVTLNDATIQAPRTAPPVPVRPDWVTAVVLEERDREEADGSPQIQISPPPTDGDFYLDDYYEETSDYPRDVTNMASERFSAEDLYNETVKQHFNQMQTPHPHHQHGREYCDGDSIYAEPETPETPDNWSDEEEVEEEYKPQDISMLHVHNLQ